ncbi:rCG63425 [Rattus norvegicus]|uniref:RCG63425 n=1 Tax=Rattus norvegicus TaxID=10116 RepID=A6IM85_RAT|nr:rCG63425 [Rattus norvegicus]
MRPCWKTKHKNKNKKFLDPTPSNKQTNKKLKIFLV